MKGRAEEGEGFEVLTVAFAPDMGTQHVQAHGHTVWLFIAFQKGDWEVEGRKWGDKDD